MSRGATFTFCVGVLDRKRSVITFRYRATSLAGEEFEYTDRLTFPGVLGSEWANIPADLLASLIEALTIAHGINYWKMHPTSAMRLEGFTLTRAQAEFWDRVYLEGLMEFYYLTRMDFRGLVSFPWSEETKARIPVRLPASDAALVMHGGGKDSILSAELLREWGAPFDLFAVNSTPAHRRVAALIDKPLLTVQRTHDRRVMRAIHKGMPWIYPTLIPHAFAALTLAALRGHRTIIFSNEKSADYGNLTYLGMPVNHQWCKASETEKLLNDYIQQFLTPDISTRSLLRECGELAIVQRFVRYPKYLRAVTSCNNYFWLPRPVQLLSRKAYWCKECPKCVFLFASFSAFLLRKEVVGMFGADLYERARLLPLFKRILGIEGFKPLDCVGEPSEMIAAMHRAAQGGEYISTPIMRFFHEHFPDTHEIDRIEERVLAASAIPRAYGLGVGWYPESPSSKGGILARK